MDVGRVDNTATTSAPDWDNHLVPTTARRGYTKSNCSHTTPTKQDQQQQQEHRKKSPRPHHQLAQNRSFDNCVAGSPRLLVMAGPPYERVINSVIATHLLWSGTELDVLWASTTGRGLAADQPSFTRLRHNGTDDSRVAPVGDTHSSVVANGGDVVRFTLR